MVDGSSVLTWEHSGDASTFTGRGKLSSSYQVKMDADSKHHYERVLVE